jgi:hypothetical protein
MDEFEVLIGGADADLFVAFTPGGLGDGLTVFELA